MAMFVQMADDELIAAIRAARPQTARRTDAISAHAEHVLAGMTHQVRRWPIVASIAASAAIVIGAATALIAAPLGIESASAAEVPMLQIQPLDVSAADEIAILTREALAQPEPADLGATAYESWDYNPASDIKQTGVQPSETASVHRADGSGTLTVVAGDVKYGSGSGLLAPGSAIQSDQFAAGGFPLVFTAAPPADQEQMLRYLSDNGGAVTGGTGEILARAAQARKEWVFDGGASAALLEGVVSQPGVTLDGETVDRLGRDSIAFSVQTRAGFRDILLFDRSTGLLDGYEAVYLGGGGSEVKLPTTNSVYSYTAWKDQK